MFFHSTTKEIIYDVIFLVELFNFRIQFWIFAYYTMNV